VALIDRAPPPPADDPDILVFNWKKRYSGVSATIAALVPVQRATVPLWLVGEPLPGCPAPHPVGAALRLSRRPPAGKTWRLWHVRRDPEMLLAVVARDVLGLPIRTVFTSSAQRRHSTIPRWLIGRMDAVIATTELAASLVPNVAAIVPHGVDAARFSPPADRAAAFAALGLPGRYAIGVAGRVRDDKGTDVFVDAMISLLPRYTDATAIVAGLAKPEDAGYLARMKAAVAEAGLGPRIVFLGEVPAARMPDIYRALSLYVAPPRHEEFGLTPIEAMACGCPVVATRTGAFADMVVEGETGALVPPGNAGVMARAIEPYLADETLMIRHGAAALERVRPHFFL
jgi:mannosyltransferase